MRTFFAMVMLLFVFSCSKENNEIKAEDINPEGSWSLFRLKLKSSTMGPLERDTTLAPCFKDVKLVFYEDGKVISRYVGDQYCQTPVSPGYHVGWSQTLPDRYGTWVKSGDTLTVVMSQPDDQMKFKLSISGKNQIISYTDPSDEYITETWYFRENK